jgi:hypothetical protein
MNTAPPPDNRSPRDHRLCRNETWWFRLARRADVARRVEHVPERKLLVIVNGIETDRFSP